MVGSAPGTERADALCVTCVGLFDVDGAAVSLVLGGASSGTFGSSSESSRRMDEYQFTFGEGPCLDAVTSGTSVLAPDLDAPQEQRWPVLRGALLEDGIRGVFAVPIMITSVCVGALDLFRSRPGPLDGVALAGALLAAELASMPLLDLMNEARDLADREDAPVCSTDHLEDPPVEADRVEVYQATGMLISALGVDADEALVRLRAHAMATDQTASQVARSIIDRRLMLDRDDRGTTGDGGRSRR
ncbi:ANTAR domain-containing protein [Nocardioides zhouii]|uniref:ANTAR domain-containing protein n=2 Tax=Nocardioides zhouii TaxID=1168729 RepID=A0A4Q2SEU2_9ACTN|nr:ANTAR domain-containing protein [Nocardioides zhouii]